MLVAIITTIVICLCIDLIRKYLIEKPLFKLLDNKIDKVQNKIKNIINEKLKID